ncbi:MAG: AI-2E family transporter [Oscillospiraceae bacterium]
MRGIKWKSYLTGKTISNIITGVVIVTAYLALQNISSIKTFLSSVYSLISPIVNGVIFAYLLNLLMTSLEAHPLKRIKHHRVKRAVSLTLSIVISLVFVAGLLTLIIPQLVKSISTLVTNLQVFVEENQDTFIKWADSKSISMNTVTAILGSWEDILSYTATWVKDTIPSVLDASIKIGSSFVNVIISLFISVYILVDKERLVRHVHLVLRAFSSERTYNRVISAGQRSHKIFSSYITGVLIDAAVVGLLCFICMSILRLPYAPLISVIVGVTDIIPTFGPFLGAVPSALFILIDNPQKALYFCIMILVIQQLDGNLIKPHILGDSTGLSALWVLIAICFFASIWGVSGMVVGVPIMAIIYIFAREFISTRLFAKGYNTQNQKLADSPADGKPTEKEEAHADNP